MSKYPKIQAGEWVKPKRRFYMMGCCDCGLVHKMEFALTGTKSRKKIIFRAWRDEKETKYLRKKDKYERPKISKQKNQ